MLVQHRERVQRAVGRGADDVVVQDAGQSAPALPRWPDIAFLQAGDGAGEGGFEDDGEGVLARARLGLQQADEGGVLG